MSNPSLAMVDFKLDWLKCITTTILQSWFACLSSPLFGASSGHYLSSFRDKFSSQLSSCYRIFLLRLHQSQAWRGRSRGAYGVLRMALNDIAHMPTGV